jgi:hypothetical protein
MLSRAAALLALTVAVAPPPQIRWQRIGVTSTGNPVFIDPRSVKRAGDVVTATVRVTYEKPFVTPQGSVSATRAIAMFDCARNLVAVKENTLYFDERTNRIYQHHVSGKPGFGPALSSTFADIALKHLCAK